MNLVKSVATLFSPILESAAIKRVRRNHALEHATIHMLNRDRYILSGRASGSGFVLFGDVPTETVEAAAEEALDRMRKGQRSLALHPNCGTNLVTAGVLLALIGAIGFAGTTRRETWERFPLVMTAMMVGSLYSQPLGMEIQRYITTSGEPGDLEIVRVRRSEFKLPFRDKPITVHNILTRKG